MIPMLIATGSGPDPLLTELASSLLGLLWMGLLLVSSVASLGALCCVLPALLPGKVQAAADQASRHPGRSTLLGAINLIGGLLLANIVGQAGSVFGLVAIAIIVGLGYFGLVGVSAIGGAVGQRLVPSEHPVRPRHMAAGGGLVALGCYFPVLGQVFGILCLCCAIGSAVATARARL